MLNEKTPIGFTYQVEVHRADGTIETDPPVHNLIPNEGLNHFAGVALKSVAQVATWHIGIYGNNYTPVAEDAAATFPANAGELTAYVNANRVTLELGAVTAGAVNNEAAKAEFVASDPLVIHGGFITSNNVKSSTTGTIISAAKFTSPKTLAAGEKLVVRAGFAFISS